jgi:hypothetical protein
MAAVHAVNLTIHKGTYFEETFQLFSEDNANLSLSNKIASAKLKKHPTASTSYPFQATHSLGTNTVKISMASTITATLPDGRCCYDVILTTNGGFISKVVEGNVMVESTISSSSGISTATPEDNNVKLYLTDLVDVNLAENSDKYVLMYNNVTKKWDAVNPDDVLSAAAVTETTQPGNPSDFIDTLGAELTDKIDFDGGTW